MLLAGVLPHAEMTSSNPAGIPRRGPFAERNPSPNQGEVRTENSSASEPRLLYWVELGLR